MASTIAAITTGIGGIVQTADGSGNLSLLSGTTTIVAVTATGATVTGALAVSGTGALTLPVGTTAERPTPVAGMNRYNSTLGATEYYNGTAWVSSSGGAAFTGVVTGTLSGSYGAGGNTSSFVAGDGALAFNTAGYRNTVVGVDALRMNSSGGDNSVFGNQALTSNTTGSNNSAMGKGALYSNTTATQNTAMGHQALYFNTTAGSNTAMGSSALYQNTTGNSNTAMGTSALWGNTTGTQNTAIGTSALSSNGAGSSNTAVGVNALLFNTGNSNTAMGRQTLYSNTTGTMNTAVGASALLANLIGMQNTAMGYQALRDVTGSGNTAFGMNSGYSVTTGSFNQTFGDQLILTAAATGRIAIGSNFTHSVDTSVVIGNGTNRISNSYTVNATWAFSSDERIKNVIGKDTLGLDFINDLEPVTFRWKPSNEVPQELTSRYAEENVQDTDLVMHGLIAQNVKAALDKAGVDTFTGWSVDADGTQKLGITDLITPMINAINELTARVKQLEGK